MRLIYAILLTASSLPSTGTAVADQNMGDLKQQVVGQWELGFIGKKKLPEKITLEFTKDGKLRTLLTGSITESTYKIEGNQLSLTHGPAEKQVVEILTIKSLANDELVLAEPGRELHLKRRVVGADELPKENPVYGKRLVGTWKVTGEQGVMLNLTADGHIAFSTGGKVTLEGSYKVEKNKIAVNVRDLSGKEMADTLTIKTLTDERLITIDSKGKEETLTRIK